MAKGKGTTKQRVKVEANGKHDPTPTALPPVNFGFRFMRLKDWCKYATWGHGKITKVKVEWMAPSESEEKRPMVRVFRDSKHDRPKGSIFVIPPSLGLVHLPFATCGTAKGWWIGDREQADRLHKSLTDFQWDYHDAANWVGGGNSWHSVSDWEEDEETMNKVLAELFAEGKISAGDERVVLIDESKVAP